MLSFVNSIIRCVAHPCRLSHFFALVYSFVVNLVCIGAYVCTNNSIVRPDTIKMDAVLLLVIRYDSSIVITLFVVTDERCVICLCFLSYAPRCSLDSTPSGTRKKSSPG